MAVYTGLFLVTIAIGFLAVRVFQSRSTPSVSNKDKAGSRSVRHQFQRQNHSVSAGLGNFGSRGNPTDTSMSAARKRPALATGAVPKPWGW